MRRHPLPVSFSVSPRTVLAVDARVFLRLASVRGVPHAAAQHQRGSRGPGAGLSCHHPARARLNGPLTCLDSSQTPPDMA